MATMTLVESSGAFVEAIEKSGLTTPETTERIRELARNVEDPLSLAKRLVKDGTFTKWQAGQLMYGFHQLVIGKYKLLEQLGAGETGRVFLAEHVQMGRRHSLKMFSRKYTSQPDVLKQFLAEAQRVSGLEHRNISHIYDVNQDAERYYLVMEYVEGQNLQSLVEKSGKLSPAVALDYIGQTAIGLAHAHENQVTHGDLKPSNLMLDGSGAIKILDLGQARLFAGPAAPAAGEDGEDDGVPAAALYHAPEQRGGDRQVDERADIYSLGSVLCFLLSGKTAETGAAAGKHLADIAGLPAEVKSLCSDLMADTPADRPQAMKTVIERIAAAQQAVSGLAVTMPAAKPAKEHVAAKAAEPAPARPKQPPRAKALVESGSMPVPRSLDKPSEKASDESLPAFAATEKPAKEDGDAFGGFAIQTKGRIGKKPPVKTAAPAAAKPAAKAVVSAEGAAEGDAAPVAAKKSYLPLIIGGSIGGGVLALAGLGLIAFFLFFGNKPTEVAEAKTTTPAASADATAAKADDGGEANPGESNPGEANPEESNPLAVLESTDPVGAETPAVVAPAAVAADKPPEPMPMPTPAATAGKTEPMPAAPAVAATDPPVPAPATEPKPPDPAATAKTDPPPAEPTKPEPKPEPEPMPAAPPANPFVGFAKAVSLPKLPTGTGEVPADALTPVVLGPCKVDDKLLVIARLMGGEFAAKGGKQKFDLKAANDGTSLRDWEFTLEGNAGPLVVAKLSAKDGNLSFQWTPEGAKEQAAPFLMNCAMELSAGPGRHIVALRTPESGPPLALDFDKATSNVKWVVENTPDPKQVHIQIVAIEGVPRKKFDPVDTIEGSGEDIIVWTGPADDAMVVGMKLTSAISGRNVQVNMAPQMKFEFMKRPEKFNKKTLANGKAAVNQRLNLLSGQLKSLPNNARDAALEQQKSLINQEIETLSKGGSQVDAVLEFMEAVKGQVQLQCRVFYVAGDTQVDLLVTAAGAEAEAKP